MGWGRVGSISSTAQQNNNPSMLRSLLPAERIVINFAPALLRLIREAKYLDQLGFSIPEVAVNTALQERRFRQHIEELRDMLEHYYRVSWGTGAVQRVRVVLWLWAKSEPARGYSCLQCSPCAWLVLLSIL